MGDPQEGQGETNEAGIGDDRSDGADGPGRREPGEEFDFLRDRFRSSYQEGSAEGPSREEVIGAFRTLGEAISNIVAGAGNTLKDPKVKQQVKKTTLSVIASISGLLADWAAELRSRLQDKCGQEDESAVDPEVVPADSIKSVLDDSVDEDAIPDEPPESS